MATTAETVMARAYIPLTPVVGAEETAFGAVEAPFVGAPVETATGAATGAATGGAATGGANGGATGAGSTVSQRLPMMPALLQTQMSPFQVPLLLHQAASYWKYAKSDTVRWKSMIGNAWRAPGIAELQFASVRSIFLGPYSQVRNE
jgi:hypothetical protein